MPLATLAALAALIPLAEPPATAMPFAPDERMDLTVEYLGIKIGMARITVGKPEGLLLPLFFQVRTGGIASFVDVRTQMVAQFDSVSMLPRGTQIDAVEIGYRHSDTTRFDREAGKATVISRGKSTTTDVVDVPAGTVDFVSLVFLLRRLPLAKGDRHAFPVLSDAKVANVVAEVIGREKIETGAGTFEAVRVRVPTGLTGKFSERDPTIIWFSDDPRHLVLRISTDFAIGRAAATLQAYQPGASTG
jgi:hypothetical protein